MAQQDPAKLARKIFIYTIVGSIICYAAAGWMLF